jgi:hypothetical protein
LSSYNNITGNFLEFGIALGGSAICLASEIGDGRRFLGFDVFGTIPPPSERDGEAPNPPFSPWSDLAALAAADEGVLGMAA